MKDNIYTNCMIKNPSNDKTRIHEKIKNVKNKDGGKRALQVVSESSESELEMSSENNNKLDIETIFKFIDLYFKQKNIMYAHQYNSFDKLLDEDIPNFLNSNNSIIYENITRTKVYRYKFKFENIAIKPPFIKIDDEMMFPSHARTRNLTYASELVATITQIQEITDIATDTVVTKIVGDKEYEYPITTIPIMVRCKYCSLNLKKGFDKSECEYDPGGYFIVNGAEKVIMSMERIIDNRPLVFIKKDSSTVTYTVQVNSKSQKSDLLQIINVKMKKDNVITVVVPILNEVPVFILMRALGVESDNDIMNLVVYDKGDIDMINIVRIALEKAKPDDVNTKITTREDAINYLIKKMRIMRTYNQVDKGAEHNEKKMNLMQMLKDNFLPHVEGGSLMDKAYYLGMMVNRLLQCFLGRIKVDDRDSFINKRIDLPGQLIMELFKQFFKKMMGECSKFFVKRNPSDENPLNIINQIKSNIIEGGIKTALLTGAWGKKKGVAQMLQRLTFLNTLSSLRRVNSPTADASTNKLTAPRHLHGTTVGPICFVETPEGSKVGLVKNLSMIGSITIMKSSQIYILKGILKPRVRGLATIPLGDLHRYTRVLLNGDIIGFTDRPRELYNELKDMKYRGMLDPLTGIAHDIRSEIECRDLRINCDSGRIYHPMLRVVDGKLLLKKDMIDLISIEEIGSTATVVSWNQFLMRFPGVVEYLDPDERYNAMCAMTHEDVINMKTRIEKSKDMITQVPVNDMKFVLNRYDEFSYVRHTHCEIHPSLLLGIVVSNIPFCQTNSGPRNVFQYSQARHAISIYITNYRDRSDIAYILYHPQRPLVRSRLSKYIYTDQLPSGENVVVAIMVYGGSNVEDSNIMNKGSVDRGLFCSTSFKKYSTTIQKNQSTSMDDVFVKPDRSQVSGMRQGTYDKLNERGFAPEETVVENGDIVLAKISPIQPGGNSKKVFKDSSEYYKSNVPGAIDRVWTNILNSEGYEMRKNRIRSMRVPVVGDKFCCFSADHQVLTKRGWIDIAKVSMEDYIATLQDGMVLDYLKPHALQEYDYQGMMFCVEGSGISLMVTPNHRMYTKGGNDDEYEITMAKEIIGLERRYLKGVNDVKRNECCDILNLGEIRRGKGKFPDWVWCLDKGQAKIIWDFANGMDYDDGEFQRLKLHAGVDDKEVVGVGYWKPFCGKVYCCSVPGEGIIYVRRNGKGVWCGNSLHAQKSTCGIKLPLSDMPFTKDGMTFDMAINPNAIPSRMTVGQLIECLVGKVAALEGHEIDGTSFVPNDIDQLKEILKGYGYNENGFEVMYNGMTGKKMKAMIFIGPTFYQRLKHLVYDKIHARARGPKTVLTRQAPEGRSRDGGLRFGEMERDSLIGHGLAKFLKERLLETADVYHIYVCGDCGLFAQRMKKKDSKSYATNKDIYFCPACKNSIDVHKIRIPYAFKLLCQEMMAMNVAPRIRVKKNPYE